ncbi:MAG: transposase [Chloroflexi bacterium]|nr:transposase [Chloroflexota bacterium]
MAIPTTNALAESVTGPYKAEFVRRRGPWPGVDDFELATLEWVEWFNNRRLFWDRLRAANRA